MTRSSLSKTFGNFVSLKEMKNYQKTRSTVDEESEEGTEEEFHLASCQELIPDSRFENFLDTTMTVAIADTIYKITADGTFFTVKGSVEDLNKVSHEFDKDKLIRIDSKCYQASKDVYLYDSFGKLSGDTVNFELENNVDSKPKTRASARYYLGQTESENDQMYGLSTYRWKTNYWGLATTLFGIFGTDGTETKEFDKNHRAKCNLYQIDYKFVETCGFTVKMQRKKKFLFVSYWVESTAENIAVGIEEFHGKTTLKMDFNNSPLNMVDRGHYVDQAFGYVNNMVYTGLCRYPMLTDWLKQQKVINTVYAGIKGFDFLNVFKKDPWSYTNKLQKSAIYSGLKLMENKLGGKAIKNDFKLDANMALVFNGVGTLDNYIRGIEVYDGNSKNITFSSSGGITVSCGGGFSITPLDPEDFTIEGIRIFGAVKYDGKWRGIRFYKNE